MRQFLLSSSAVDGRENDEVRVFSLRGESTANEVVCTRRPSEGGKRLESEVKRLRKWCDRMRGVRGLES